MIELLDNPESINTMGNEVRVTVGGVACVFKHDYKPGTNLVYVTTLSSRQGAYQNQVSLWQRELNHPMLASVRDAVPDQIYKDYIHHLRKDHGYAALMTRDQMITILKSGQYVLA